MSAIAATLKSRLKRPDIKPLAERNRVAVGVTGIAIVVALVVGVFSYNKIPFIKGTSDYSAYFAEAGGIKTGSDVRVSGLSVGRVFSVKLDGQKVLVKFSVNNGVELGDRTEAAIKTETVLGTKMLELTPRGDGKLTTTIPLERTSSPYDLPTALGDLTTTISALDTTKLSSALTTLADTFKDTPPDLKVALEGVARFSGTLDNRDAALRNLLADANKVTSVLAKRSDQIANLVVNANALLRELLTQRNSVDALMTSLTDASHQISGLVNDNRRELQPALDKLNGVLGILDNRKQELQRTLYLLRRYAMSFGEVLGSGPFFKASLVNLAPGQLVQPFTDAAFSDLGLDPNVLLPSELVAPPTGTPGLPPLPLPYPRTGQGGEPKRTLPDAITGNPGQQSCGPPAVPLPAPGCYPYREPPPAAAPGEPPPGPPASPTPAPAPTPIYVPAPNEVPASGGR
ncbi:Mce-family protein Mce3C [Mycobacterium tuberculosis H37Rv] [Mycobacterium shimoidei]|uniref:Mce-family protein Mce3C [Mycobacterium tuberculosis H37Rv] n=1 Tax=Mycobacterium shimoidei TaxID=29313 RepID=A0A375YVA4_MYCSH|nr:MCE family protein [Mycobacterium shimoidei]SRX92762.1 Mce-family protein Mce3C [Mycobacterium tuberculosis H37Rv] [Mycobacterium shimoidei]